jgi:hypothetical protein
MERLKRMKDALRRPDSALLGVDVRLATFTCVIFFFFWLTPNIHCRFFVSYIALSNPTARGQRGDCHGGTQQSSARH